MKRESCGQCPYIKQRVKDMNNGKAGCVMYSKRKKESGQDSNSKG